MGDSLMHSLFCHRTCVWVLQEALHCKQGDCMFSSTGVGLKIGFMLMTLNP